MEQRIEQTPNLGVFTFIPNKKGGFNEKINRRKDGLVNGSKNRKTNSQRLRLT